MLKAIFSAALIATFIILTPAISTASAEEVAGTSPEKAILNEMIARQNARNKAGPKYYVTVESNSLGSGGAISVFQKLDENLGYWHMPPEMLTAIFAAGAEPAATAILDAVSQAGAGAGYYDFVGFTNDLFGVIFADVPEIEEEIKQTYPEARASMDAIRKFRDTAKLGETTQMGGRESFFLLATGLNFQQQAEDGVYTINNMGLWIDTQRYVITGMRFTGTSKTGSKKKTDDFEILQILSDYRPVGGSSVIIPFQKGMKVRIGSVNNEDSKKIQQAKAEMEAQMAKMKQMVTDGKISQGQYDAMMQQMEKVMGKDMAILDSVAEDGVGAEVKVTKTWAAPTQAELKKALEEATEMSAKGVAGDTASKAQ